MKRKLFRAKFSKHLGIGLVVVLAIAGIYIIYNSKAACITDNDNPGYPSLSPNINDCKPQVNAPEQVVALAGILFLSNSNFSAAKNTIASKYNAQIISSYDDIKGIYIKFNGVNDLAQTNAKIALIKTETALVQEAEPVFTANFAAVTPGDEGAHEPVGANDTYMVETSLSPRAHQWGIKKTNTQYAWYHSTGSFNTIIGVIDSGVDPNHPDLQGKIAGCYNVVTKSYACKDYNYHGTMVSGVLAANVNNGRGTAGYCYACRIYMVGVYGDSLENTGVNRVADGVDYLTKHSGVKIINISMATTKDSSVLREKIKKAVEAGKVIVAGAGNLATNTYAYPAAYDGVIAVAATNGNDGIDNYWSNSSFGRWVDVGAPACNTTSWITGNQPPEYISWDRLTKKWDWPEPYNPDDPNTVDSGEKKIIACGTSFAAPAVAGILGLLPTKVGNKPPSWYRTCLDHAFVPVGSNEKNTLVQTGRIEAHLLVAQAIAFPNDCTP